MRSLIGTLTTTLFFIAIDSKSFAQINFSGYELGINAGTLIYQGDLTPDWFGSTKFIRPAIGIYVSKSLDSYFSLRANFTHGKLSANESVYSTPGWRQNRNFKFNSSVNEFSSTLVFNPFGGNNGNYSRRLSPYVFAGAGISLLNIKRNWSGFNTTYFDIKSPAAISLAADTIHPLPKAVAILPVGIGLKYILTQRLAFNAESTWRITSSDYIDGFKYQGKSNKRDAYYGLTLGVSFRFGKDKYACPTASGF